MYIIILGYLDLEKTAECTSGHIAVKSKRKVSSDMEYLKNENQHNIFQKMVINILIIDRKYLYTFLYHIKGFPVFLEKICIIK